MRKDNMKHDINIPECLSRAKAETACPACPKILTEVEKLYEKGGAEAVLKAKDAPFWVYWYARYIVQGRWPEAEPLIKQNARWAFWYARDVIKGRWPEAEPTIKQNAKWASWYARPEAEPIIMQDAEWASWYAEDVIKGQWRIGSISAHPNLQS